MSEHTSTADDAIANLVIVAAEYAQAKEDEMALEDGRPAVKQVAVLRVMQGTNPLTGKPHSASSAESVVETDPEYLGYRVTQREAVVSTIMSRARFDAAKFRCALLCGVAAIEA